MDWRPPEPSGAENRAEAARCGNARARGECRDSRGERRDGRRQRPGSDCSLGDGAGPRFDLHERVPGNPFAGDSVKFAGLGGG
jgi:hypothetical protein